VPLFSFPFVRLSFAPAPSSFALLKTIVRSGKLILGNHLSIRSRRAPRCGGLRLGEKQGIEYREQPARGGSWSPPLAPEKRRKDRAPASKSALATLRPSRHPPRPENPDLGYPLSICGQRPAAFFSCRFRLVVKMKDNRSGRWKFKYFCLASQTFSP
jgi:hypothetical protein